MHQVDGGDEVVFAPNDLYYMQGTFVTCILDILYIYFCTKATVRVCLSLVCLVQQAGYCTTVFLLLTVA